MSFAQAAEHARKAAEKADIASLISAGMFEFKHDMPVTEKELPRLSFETLCMAVNELAHAIEALADAQSKG